MENKNVGWLLLGISLVIIVIILLFNSALKEIVLASCGEEHGLVCTMNNTIDQQTYLSLAIVGILILISFIMIFSKQREKVVIRKIKDKKETVSLNLNELSFDERKIYRIIQEKGAVFQSEIIRETNIPKTKVTRILDKLENKGALERKRKGANNLVVIK